MTNENNNPPPVPSPNSLEILLIQQTRELNAVFQKYLQVGQRRYLCDSDLLMAMRAQAQCRSTVHTLHQWQKMNNPSQDKE